MAGHPSAAETKTLDEVRTLLRDAGLRSTPARIAVYRELKQSRRPMTHAEVTDKLAGWGFDKATVFRNLSDLGRGIAEMARVLKPGGRLVILEITQPTRPPLSTFFSVWFDRIVPLIGRFAGDSAAYNYLPESVKRFPSPAGLAAIMDGAGLERIRWTILAGGIIAIHSGRRPE